MEITKCEYFFQTKTDLVGEEESETEIPCRRNMVTGGDSANIYLYIGEKYLRTFKNTLNVSFKQSKVTLWNVSEELSVIPVPLQAVQGIPLKMFFLNRIFSQPPSKR